MHVVLLHEEKKPSKCSKFIHSFFTKNFKRLIDVVHEGRKLSFNESLTTNLKLVSLDTNFKQIAL